MKKTLLLFLLCVGVAAVQAQNQKKPQVQRFPTSKLIPLEIGDHGVPANFNPFVGLNHGSSTNVTSRAIIKSPIGSSANLFGVLVEDQQIVSGNQDVNIIQMIHRLNNSEVVAGGSSGSIESSFSIDGGITWDSTLIVYQGVVPYDKGRYPQGGIVNPPGNTDPTKAFSLCAGPIVEADWIATYLASANLDGTNDSSTVFDNTISPVLENMSRVDFWTGGSNAYSIGVHQVVSATAGGSGPFYGGVENVGVYNATTNDFDWNQTVVDDPFWYDSTGASNVFQVAYHAWSADGQTGYIVFYGVDSIGFQSSFVPIVFESQDAGRTWTRQSDYDFTSIPIFQQNLITNWDGKVRPWFYPFDNGSDLAVDKNGNLHILCEVLSGAGSTVDSSGFTWTDYRQDYYDTYMTGDGNWNATFIDSIQTYPPGGTLPDGTTAPNPYAADAVTYDARVQIATNADRDKFFMLWMDSDPANSLTNLTPDIHGIDWDLEGRKSEERNFTAGSIYEQSNYWLCASNLAMEDGLGNFNIPATTTIDGSIPVFSAGIPNYHSYVAGIQFPASDFVGISNVVKHSFSVTPMMPNPVNGSSNFLINLDKPSNVTVEVTNMIGEKMMVNDYTFSSGSHPIFLSKNHLSSGVYFYTVKVGDDQITNKMVIQ